MPVPESSLDPATRSHTALFVVFGSLLNKLREVRGKGADDIEYAVNRPGQDTVECYTLAALTFVLLTGYFTVVIGESWGAVLWSFVAAFPLAVMLTFVTLHLLFFVLDFIYRSLKSIGFFPPAAAEEMSAWVYLFFITLLALFMVSSGKWALIFIATPWLIGVALNFVCSLIFFAGNFISQIKGDFE